MGRYLYRAQPGYEKGTSIKCKDPYSETTLPEHIAHGSTRPSKYISTTTMMGVGMVYSLEMKNKEDTVRHPIVLIDRDKLEKYTILHDTSNPEVAREIEKNDLAKKMAPASREVVAEIEIPSECIREVPTICVDMIRALECVHSKHSKKVIETINDLIMNDDIMFRFLLENTTFEGLMQEFYEKYYKSSDRSLRQISDEMFQGDLDMANCFRVQLIREMFQKKEIASYIQARAKELHGIEKESSSNAMRFVSRDYADVISSKLLMVADESKGKTTKKEVDDKFVFGGIGLAIKSGEQIEIPCGVDIEGKKVIKKHYVVERTIGYIEGKHIGYVLENGDNLVKRSSIVLGAKVPSIQDTLVTQTADDSEFIETVNQLDNTQKPKIDKNKII